MSAGTISTRYFHSDHLGSIAVITDEEGVVLERDSYDAWGNRRFPNGIDDPTDSITSQTSRGFTGQEELADVGPVHLNGRVYDPLVGRMMSADPHVPVPSSGQSWNRYSYVINNPLSFTDPTGYDFFSDIGDFFSSAADAIGGFFSDAVNFVGNVLSSSLKAVETFSNRVPIGGNILEIAAAAVCGPLCAGVATSFVAGVTTGNFAYALKSGLLAAATFAAFQGVPTIAGQVANALPGNLAPAAFQVFKDAGSALV